MIAADREAAESHCTLGNDLVKAGQEEAAIASYRRAIALDPGHAAALNNLGCVLRDCGDLDEALACYRRALAVRPDLWGTYTNIAITQLHRHSPDEAIAPLRRAIALRPNDADTWNNLGGALLAIDRPDDALPCFRRAVELRPAMPSARLGVALAMLSLGRLREGWKAYECRWDDPVLSEGAHWTRHPRWRGEPIAGRTILLASEQGLGDTIQFARYAPMVARRGARVVLLVDQVLTALLAPLADAAVAVGDAVPKFDIHCPLMSLPHVFATDLASIPAEVPYLAPDSERAAVWAQRLGDRRPRRIGIAFSGSAENVDDAERSIPAEDLIRAVAAPARELHVLQTDIRPADAAALARHPDVRVHADALTDFAETAALAAQMDLVVTVDTSIAHLAGALGLQAWILLPFAADFRWMRQRTDSPWYPTVRLFRQPALHAWQPVLDQVSAALGG